MAGNADALPRALLQNLECNKVLHERVVLLTIGIRDYPWVASNERIEVKPLGYGFYRLMIYFGFVDRPDVSQALELCGQRGLELDPLHTWFLLSGHSHGQKGHGAVARTAVRGHGTQCAHCRRLLQHPLRPRH
jgi:KUP system potassium uptake protein